MTPFQDIGDDARRQYIDARSAFEALEAARVQAAGVRGGMYWKTVKGTDYLVRTSARNARKAWGRAVQSEAMYASFTERKGQAEAHAKTSRRRCSAISD